ncbi:alpha-N-acetylglucosaminidase isoform X2 [Syngnathoides biaculeatus]|uniref:alpha-N-acetylglucosaminidase isoform X2 n=1 Tax=Syngnathoides biaculeatus TaxID=300417 RepID=UPI002ADE14DB|nr:alpha-N-acetylglucosaminidase isoform X2 [Syngnathoides biaculeatus]
MLHRSDCYLLYIVVLYLSVTATCKFSTLDHLKSQASDKKQGRAVAELLRRLLGNRSAEFVVLVNRSLSNDSLDVCELRSTKNNKIVATGNSGVSVASGIYNYLKYFCNCHVSWSGDQLDLPRPLPKLSGVLRINTQHRFRYYQNVCTFSYSSVWWDWPRWEREIDWMALNGINLPLAFTGQEAIWQEVYRALGLNQSEIEEFFAGPAFLAWNRMGNMFEFGGPLPQSWHVNQLTLQVASRGKRNKIGAMGSLQLQLLVLLYLGPSGPTFPPDWFPLSFPDPAYLSAVSRSVFASMTAVDPQAIWLMQGWLFFSAATFWKPAQIQALLHGVPLGRMIVLDLFAETEPIFSYTESFYGQPFIWCMLQNFGGNSGLFGTVESINSGPFKALHFPNSTMVGIGMTPEGIEQNPVMYELMSELAWRKEPVNLVKWASLYAIRRYGTTQDSLITAWRLLFSSVYNCTLPHYRNHNHSPLVRRPSLHMNTDLWYNPADLFNAWKLIIEVSPSLMSKETFRYDLVDVTREVLQVLTTSFYLDITDAFHKQKLPELLISAGVLIYDLLPELNRLLCSDRNFLLGKWLEQAKSLAIDEEEAQLYDMNARNQLTLWGPSGEIQDYASKEWGGLMEDYYAQRWGLFVQTLVKCLDSGQPFKQDAFNQAVFQVEKGFIYNGRKYPTKPQGDTYEITRRIFLKYYPQALKRLL